MTLIDPATESRTIRDQTGKTLRLLFMFIDVVAYSREPDGRQLTIIINLQEFIKKSSLIQFTEPQGAPWRTSILLPTGDGLALCLAHPALFEHPNELLTFAEYLRAEAEAHNIGLRIGLHSEDGRIYEDINGLVNVAGNGINITQRVMSQGDRGHILTSHAFFNVVAAKCGEPAARRHLRTLGTVEVKHGVSLELFVHSPPGADPKWSNRPSKQEQRRLIQNHLITQLKRIVDVWQRRFLGIPEPDGSKADPDFRATLLHNAPSPEVPGQTGLAVSYLRYWASKPWAVEEDPPQVFFDKGQGPARVLVKARESDGSYPFCAIFGLPDAGGSRHPTDPRFKAYAEALERDSRTPRQTIGRLRRHARAYVYVPFGMNDDSAVWDGVISIDSARPLEGVDRGAWASAVTGIQRELEAIAFLWRLRT